MASLEPKKEYSSKVRKVEPTDLAHANLLNEINQIFINNDVYAKEHIEKSDIHIANNSVHVTPEEKENWHNKAEKSLATQSENGLQSASDKQKLDNIEECAQVNQNAISFINVNDTIIQSNEKESQIILAAGSNITISADNATKKITISADKNGGDAATISGLTVLRIVQQGGKHLAGQGTGSGYSFLGDGAEDTGLFSDGDGDLYLMKNGRKINLPWDGTIPNTAGTIANATNAANADTVGNKNVAELQNYNNLSNKPSTFPPSYHTHDERYYTGIEINNKLAEKANVNNPSFTGIAKAAENTSYTVPQLRNVFFGTEELNPGVSYLANGAIYIQYE